MDQPVTPFDLQRMFFGEHPALFYAEIVVRTLIIYAYTLGMIRWVGGRGVAQLSMVEFLLVIALGSAVGDSMFYPDVPLLFAMAVITLVVATNKLLDLAIVRSDRMKELIDGKPVALVHDGRLLPEGLAARDLGAAEVKAMLRSHGVANLAEVEHAFMEAGGALSLFRQEAPRPGLPLVPPEEIAPRPALESLAGLGTDAAACCGHCGALSPAADVVPDGQCRYCGQGRWVAPEWARGDGEAERQA